MRNFEGMSSTVVPLGPPEKKEKAAPTNELANLLPALEHDVPQLAQALKSLSDEHIAELDRALDAEGASLGYLNVPTGYQAEIINLLEQWKGATDPGEKKRTGKTLAQRLSDL